jgi:molecular chaperone HscB
MTDPFDILGVPRRFRLDLARLEQRHRDLSRALHPDRHVNAAPAERRIALEHAAAVNDAFRALKSPQSRAAALLATAGRVIAEDSRADPALLMEVMDLREQLDDARHAPRDGRHAAVARLRAAVESHVAAEEAAIAEAFDTAETPPAGAPLDRAHTALIKLRYYYRFLEEADAIEADEAL